MNNFVGAKKKDDNEKKKKHIQKMSIKKTEKSRRYLMLRKRNNEIWKTFEKKMDNEKKQNAKVRKLRQGEGVFRIWIKIILNKSI